MATDSPLVHRTVRTGGVLLAVAAVQFVSVVLWVESRTPGFSWSHTNLLALGGASGVWAYVVDASLAVGGALAAVGLLFGWTAFDELPSRGLGILILFAGSLATVGVGALLAAGSHVPASAVSAAVYVAVLATGLGLLVVSRAMHLHGRWRVSSAYTFLSGLVVLGAVAVLAITWHPSGRTGRSAPEAPTAPAAGHQHDHVMLDEKPQGAQP